MADYRRAPELAPLARVEGSELHVARGTVLPRVCLRCGTTAKLRTRARDLVWRPIPQGAFLLFGWLALLIGQATRRVSTITFSMCPDCERRALDAVAGKRFSALSVLVVLLVAATVGFNAYPVLGLLILALGTSGAVVAYRYFSRRTHAVAWIQADGTVALRGVHAALAQAAVEHRSDPA